MYESPIQLLVADIQRQIMEQQENEIYKAVLHYVPYVDKEELIRALQYDRDQYDNGYADGKRDAMNELVRCKDCKHYDQRGFCDSEHWEDAEGWSKAIEPDDFCSYGERKDGEG